MDRRTKLCKARDLLLPEAGEASREAVSKAVNLVMELIDSEPVAMDALEKKVRIDSLKTAALVMDGVAEGFKDAEVKNKTKSLAYSITWAVKELERLL